MNISPREVLDKASFQVARLPGLFSVGSERRVALTPRPSRYPTAKDLGQYYYHAVLGR